MAARQEFEETKQISDSLRISQLDASELDHEVLQLMKSQLTNIFKYFKPGILSRIEPELDATLRFVIWKFTLDRLGATVGQQILDLKYANIHALPSYSPWITHSQKYLLALILIGGQWLKDRSHDIVQLTGFAQSDKVIKGMKWVEIGWKLARLVNFVVFLQEGHFQLLLERLLGIRSVYPRAQMVRQVGFEFITRELLWHGFAEFLFFVLPLINFQRIRNLTMKYLLPSRLKSSVSARCPADYKECIVCGEWPIRPHQIGCKHVFCYYCIQSNYISDCHYSCPACGCTAADEQTIQPVTMTIHKR